MLLYARRGGRWSAGAFTIRLLHRRHLTERRVWVGKGQSIFIRHVELQIVEMRISFAAQGEVKAPRNKRDEIQNIEVEVRMTGSSKRCARYLMSPSARARRSHTMTKAGSSQRFRIVTIKGEVP